MQTRPRADREVHDWRAERLVQGSLTSVPRVDVGGGRFQSRPCASQRGRVNFMCDLTLGIFAVCIGKGDIAMRPLESLSLECNSGKRQRRNRVPGSLCEV